MYALLLLPYKVAGVPCSPFGNASLHSEQGTPIPLANDLQTVQFSMANTVQIWMAVDDCKFFAHFDSRNEPLQSVIKIFAFLHK